VADHKGNAAYVTPNSALVTAGLGQKIQDSVTAMKAVNRDMRRATLRNRLTSLGVALGIGSILWYNGGRELLSIAVAKQRAQVSQERRPRVRSS